MPNCNVLQEISNLRDKCILRLKWEEEEEEEEEEKEEEEKE